MFKDMSSTLKLDMLRTSARHGVAFWARSPGCALAFILSECMVISRGFGGSELDGVQMW